jgi:membrane protein implicated in regulation of membrane protease activity
VPVLPLIDLLILLGWTSLATGAVLKAVSITTVYRPTLLSLAPLDLVVVAAVCFAFALTLAARTWVKLNEPRLLQLQRRNSELRARRRALEGDLEPREGADPQLEVPRIRREEATAGHR